MATYNGDNTNNTYIGTNTDDVIYGNGGDDSLNGADGNDQIYGGDGNDILNGGLGNDYLQGDNGADTYLIAEADGQDEINNYHSDNSMDVVTFTDMASTDITSVTRAQDGSDNLILTYSTGGQLTVDNYFSDAAYQIDTFQFTDSVWGLADIIARASAITGTADSDFLSGFNDWSNTLLGLGGDDYLFGGIGDDVLIGGDGNDWLQGMEGNDTLIGGTGNDIVSGGYGIDTYLIAKADGQDEIDDTLDDSADVVIFTDMTRADITSVTHSQDGRNSLVLTYGTDGQLTVDGYFNDTPYRINTFQFTDGTWTLTDILIRTSVITGTANDDLLFGFDTWSSTIYGLGGNDTLYGGSSADTIIGGDGNDTLNGGLGNDYLEGDNGADTYLIALADGQDEINNYDTDGSVDVVTFTDVTLSDLAGISTNGTNLYLNYGTASQLVVDNYFYGDAYQVNQFQFAGGDMLANFVIGTDSSNDTLTGTNANDAISGLGGADTMAGGLGNDLYFVDNAGDVVTEASGAGTDTLLSSISYTLAANVENLILTGSNAINGTGNDLANMLTGNAAANVLAGGLGNDTYIVDNAADNVIENSGEGSDTVQAPITYSLGANVENLTLTGTATTNGTGNGLANTLIGNSANNTLDGGIGADTLVGGWGDDLYVVDNVGDVVMEDTGGGIDIVQASVSYTLAANVENLTLTGTAAIYGIGNSLANTLIGNTGANLLDGGANADNLKGGLGNDQYRVDNIGDNVFENAGEGTDTVQSLLSYSLVANVENLILLNAPGAINGTGNELANMLTGNTAANVLDGGAGADTLTGGLGNDTFIVDNVADSVVENSGEGTDTVQASVSYTLAANIENLTLTGTAALNGTGNTLANVLTGNGAVNILNGGAGADTLTGGAGSDTFVFGTVTGGADKALDFVSGTDKLQLLDGVAGLSIGNGDHSINNAALINGHGGFSTLSELVVVTPNIIGVITAAKAATDIGSAASSYAIGDTRLFAVDNGVDSALYLFKSAGADAVVSAGELTLLGTLQGTAQTVLADYGFA
ncbi:MAG: calcium-binding protein [Methylovulum sp.]|nr:calcium-binding protein [Methylovulum sp.]